MAWAREMRGMASMAKAVAPALASARTVSGAPSGLRKPMRIELLPRRWASSAVAAPLTPPSASQTSSEISAPASAKVSSGIDAPAPAPDWTSTVWPLPVRRLMPSGTRATRRSRSPVSVGTPILIGARTLVDGQRDRPVAADRQRELVGEGTLPRREGARGGGEARIVGPGDDPRGLLVDDGGRRDEARAGAQAAGRAAIRIERGDRAAVRARTRVDAARVRPALELAGGGVGAQRGPAADEDAQGLGAGGGALGGETRDDANRAQAAGDLAAGVAARLGAFDARGQAPAPGAVEEGFGERADDGGDLGRRPVAVEPHAVATMHRVAALRRDAVDVQRTVGDRADAGGAAQEGADRVALGRVRRLENLARAEVARDGEPRAAGLDGVLLQAA